MNLKSKSVCIVGSIEILVNITAMIEGPTSAIKSFISYNI